MSVAQLAATFNGSRSAQVVVCFILLTRRVAAFTQAKNQSVC